MSVLARVIDTFEGAPLPDVVRTSAVSILVSQTKRKLERTPGSASALFAREMEAFPIAVATQEANEQHYEVPAAFFKTCLGPRLKYSSCLFDQGVTTLAAAEERALTETCAMAELADGQSILELGCGWGSLSLWMAEHYPHAQITSVSNSASQRAHIEGVAREKGFTNLRVITADMNAFEINERFDRIVSVEMFEHMSNWRALLERCRTWLKPDGSMFIHVFAHKTAPYRFDVTDPADWIAQHFFTGGVMPSRDLMHQFGDVFRVEQDRWWDGRHYAKTARAWLENFDAHVEALRPVLTETYGRDAKRWERRWRLFFMATAGLFEHDRGQEWGVAQYRLKPV